jgi:pimeloyl-ACP methyl ester carboxylesterase
MSVSSSLGEVREVRVGGATLRYREAGEGATLVFLHGLAVNGDLWRNVVPQLSARFRCITPDLPLGGHDIPVDAPESLSPREVARMVAEMLTALDLHDVTVVANDTGGAITQMLITEHPDAPVARVVLTPCDAFEHFLPPAFKPLQWLGRWPWFWWAAAQLVHSRLLQRTPLAFGLLMHGLPPRDVVRSYLGPLRQPLIRRDVAAFTRRISSRDTVAAGEKLHWFGRPVLIAWGDSDLAFPRSYGRRLASAFGANARLEFVARSRTFVPEDQPVALAKLIAEFAG